MTAADLDIANTEGSSILYGEVLPSGVCKLLDASHLDAAHARTLFDLGMGTGKFAMQGILQCIQLHRT